MFKVDDEVRVNSSGSVFYQARGRVVRTRVSGNLDVEVMIYGFNETVYFSSVELDHAS